MHLKTHPKLQELPLVHYHRMRELQVLGHRDAILWIVLERHDRTGDVMLSAPGFPD